jgi:hypothetical protein
MKTVLTVVFFVMIICSRRQASAQIPAPSNLVATSGDAAITLTWTDNSSNEQGFMIERKSGSGGTWSRIATVGANVTSYSDPSSGLSLGIQYDYRVFAYNGVNASFYSNESLANLIINPPSNVSAANGDAAIRLTWTDNSSKEAGFTIERKAGLSGAWAAIATTAANATSYSDSSSGLSFGIQYYYRMYAVNGGYASFYSAETSAALAINEPSGVSAVNGDGAITITWIDNSSKEAGFKIERKAGSSGNWAVVATVAANSTSYSDPSSGLDLGVTYYYRLYAYNGVYASVYSAESSASLFIATPTGVTATGSDAGISLLWVDNSSREDGFKIERKAGAGGTWALIATTSANATSYLDPASGLSTGITYYYRMYAYNGGGFASFYSSEVSAALPPVKRVTVTPLSLTFSSSPRQVVDLLVFSTPAAEAQAGSKAALWNEIAAAVKQANEAYVNSQVNHRMRLLDIQSINYTEAAYVPGDNTTGIGADILRLINKSDGYLDGVHGIRDQVGADIVALIEAPAGSDPKGGISKTMHSVSPSFESDAFCVVRRTVLNGTSFGLAHEIGHIMGCGHDHAQAVIDGADGGGAYPYSYGYIFQAGGTTYGDIMSYPPAGASRIPYFSNPDVLFGAVPTGVPGNDPTTAANNALTMNNTASTVATFRGTVSSGDSFTIANTTSGSINVTSITPESSAGYITLSPAPPFAVTAGGSQTVTVSVDMSAAPFGYSNVRLIVSTDNSSANPVAGGVAIVVDNSVPTVATPNISPNGGSFADAVPVSIDCNTSGATIRYTTDGSEPTSGSPAYNGSFTLTSSCVAKAKAFKTGYYDSATASAEFTITPTVVTPTISPPPGTFVGYAMISISCATSGADIHYTLDGSDPSSGSTLYISPFALRSSGLVKGKAFKSGYNASGVTSASFAINAYPAPQLLIHAGAGGFQISVTGYSGASCVLEWSPDCRNWTPFTTSAVPVSGVLEISDSPPAASPMGFYRASLY